MGRLWCVLILNNAAPNSYADHFESASRFVDKMCEKSR